jgi:hypothetical protein
MPPPVHVAELETITQAYADNTLGDADETDVKFKPDAGINGRVSIWRGACRGL